MPSSQPRIAIVVNGNAKSVNEEVISTIRKHLKGADLFVSRRIEEAPEIARKIVELGYRTVFTGGGDGTFGVMVTELLKVARSQKLPVPRFALLKLGTGNAMASVVGACPLPRRNDLDLEVLVEGATVHPIRLVEVEGQLTPFAGLGADAQILADYNRTRRQWEGTPLSSLGRGLSGYGMAVLSRSIPAMLFQKMPEILVINEGDDIWPVDDEGIHRDRAIRKGEVVYQGPARMAALSAIQYYGFGMKLFPFADSSKEKVCLRVSRLGPPQVLTHFRGIWNGTYRDPRYFSDYLVESVRIECKMPLDFQIGGDSFGLREMLRAGMTQETLELLDFPTSV